MCPTPLGRVQTRVATLVLPAVLGVILSIATGKADWIVLIGVLLLLGVALDTALYSWLLKYQPPWMTFVLALGEFGLLYVLAQILKLDLSPLEAIVFYWVSWALAASTKIVLLPILSLTYLESALEFRRCEWSIPPAQVSLPVLASPDEARGGAGPVVRAASGVHAVPLERLPSPSGVHAVPDIAARAEAAPAGALSVSSAPPTDWRGDVPPPVVVTPAVARVLAPAPGEAPAFDPPAQKRRGSAARRVEATVISFAVVLASAVAVVGFFVQR